MLFLCVCEANFQEQKARAQKEEKRAEDLQKKKLEREDEEYAYNLNIKRRYEEEAHQLAISQNQFLLQQSKDNARVQLHERESTYADGLYTKRRHLTNTLLETAMAG